MSIFCVKNLRDEIIAGDFTKKSDAKKKRDALRKDGSVCVVSRGASHWRGMSTPEPGCLAVERTSKKKDRKKVQIDHAEAA